MTTPSASDGLTVGGYALVYGGSKLRVSQGAELGTFSGQAVVITGGRPPTMLNHSGSIYVRLVDGLNDHEVPPSLCGLEWVPHDGN